MKTVAILYCFDCILVLSINLEKANARIRKLESVMHVEVKP